MSTQSTPFTLRKTVLCLAAAFAGMMFTTTAWADDAAGTSNTSTETSTEASAESSSSTNCFGSQTLPVSGEVTVSGTVTCSGDQTFLGNNAYVNGAESNANLTLGYGSVTDPQHALMAVSEDADQGTLKIMLGEGKLVVNGVEGAKVPTIQVVRTTATVKDTGLLWGAGSIELNNVQMQLGFGDTTNYQTKAQLASTNITLNNSQIKIANNFKFDFGGDGYTSGNVNLKNSSILSIGDSAKPVEFTMPTTITGFYKSDVKILKKHGATDGDHVLINPALMGSFTSSKTVSIKVGNAEDHSYVWGQIWREGVPTEQLALYSTGETSFQNLDQNTYAPDVANEIQGNVYVENGFTFGSKSATPFVGQIVVNRNKVNSSAWKPVLLDFEGTDENRVIDAFLYDATADFTTINSNSSNLYLQNMTWKVRANSKWQVFNGYEKTTFDMTVNHGSSVTFAKISAQPDYTPNINFKMYVNPRSKKEGSMLYVLDTEQNQTWNFDIVVDGNKPVAGKLYDTPVRIASYKSEHTVTPVLHSIVVKDASGQMISLPPGDFKLTVTDYSADDPENANYDETDATKLQGQYRPSIFDTKIWFNGGHNIVLQKVDKPTGDYLGSESPEPDYKAEHDKMTTPPASATSVEEKQKQEEEAAAKKKAEEEAAAKKKAEEEAAAAAKKAAEEAAARLKLAREAQAENVDAFVLPPSMFIATSSLDVQEAQTTFATTDAAALPKHMIQKTAAFVRELRKANAFKAPQSIGVRVDLGFVSGKNKQSFTGNRQALTASYNRILGNGVTATVALQGQRSQTELKNKDAVSLMAGGLVAGMSYAKEQFVGRVQAGAQFGSAEFKQDGQTAKSAATLMNVSVQGEYRIPVKAQVVVAPTVQLAYSRLGLAEWKLNGTTVKPEASNNFSVRVGARAEYENMNWSAFAAAQLRYDAVAENKVTLSSLATGSQELTVNSTGVGAQLSAGANYQVNEQLSVAGGLDYMYLPKVPAFVNVNLGVNYQF